MKSGISVSSLPILDGTKGVRKIEINFRKCHVNTYFIGVTECEVKYFKVTFITSPINVADAAYLYYRCNL